MAENASNTSWNEAGPEDSEFIRRIPEEIRVLRSAVRTGIEKEHTTVEGTSSIETFAFLHRKGSARVYLQSGWPSSKPDDTVLSTTPATDVYDDGRLAIDTAQSNLLRVYIATSAGVSTGLKRIMVEAFKLAETGLANGHVIGGIGTGTQSGEAIHVGQLNTGHFEGISTGLIEVKISTGLATAHATGIRVQDFTEYAPSIFGAWEEQDDTPANLVKDTTYKATSDGVIVAKSATGSAAWGWIKGYSDSNVTLVNTVDASVLRALVGSGFFSYGGTCILFVRKDHYWRITDDGQANVDTIFWLPFGNGVCQDQS